MQSSKPKLSRNIIIVLIVLAIIIAGLIFWFLHEKIVKPLITWAQDNTLISTVISLLIFLALIYLGYFIYLLYKEKRKLRSVLKDEAHWDEFIDRHDINWGWFPAAIVEKKRAEDNEEKELDRYCEKLIDDIDSIDFEEDYGTEVKYQFELNGRLKGLGYKTKTEETHNDSRLDIIVNRKIAVEVKGPTKTEAWTRIQEQCASYTRSEHPWKRVIFVLFKPEYSKLIYHEKTKSLKKLYKDKLYFIEKHQS